MPGSSDIRTKGFIALMVTVFINALNDNFFRLVIIFVAIREFVTNDEDTFYYSLVGFVFLLPFVVFSPYAGFVADRYSTKHVIVWTRLAEAMVLITGGVMLVFHNMIGLFVALFLMGLQSTFFSPGKFGILPEVVARRSGPGPMATCSFGRFWQLSSAPPWPGSSWNWRVTSCGSPVRW